MGSRHCIQTNPPVPTSFNIANTTFISLNAYIDHNLGHGIPITYANYSITEHFLEGLHESKQYQRVVNDILANAPDPANTSIMVGYLWSDEFQGTNTRQKDNSE